ncbi:hypothetical protein MRX96_016412 [Rhipicephalus microplus]
MLTSAVRSQQQHYTCCTSVQARARSHHRLLRRVTDEDGLCAFACPAAAADDARRTSSPRSDRSRRARRAITANRRHVTET